MQVIISYSKHDREIAESLHRELVNLNIDVWLDQINILPGENWQKNIEDAIKQCGYMLLLLSPNSVNSAEVEAEWNLAKSLNKKIIPVLLAETEIPFRLRTYQHIDFKNKGLGSIILELKNIIPESDIPKHMILNWSESYDIERKYPKMYTEITLWLEDSRLDCDSKRHVLVKNNSYTTVKSLLDDLYLNYLVKHVSAYSYGSEWILLNGGIIAAPFEWINKPGKPLQEVNNDWISSTLLVDIYFYPGSEWSIVSKSKLKEYLENGIYGVATNDIRLYNMACSLPKSSCYIVSSKSLFKKSNKRDANKIISNYKYHSILRSFFSVLKGNIYIQANESPDEHEIERVWHIACRLA